MSYKKILIIEDEEVFLKPLQKFLTLKRFQVNIAKNATVGLDLQDNINFDIIITDLKMEGMTGVDAINRISAKYPNARIIVVSGFLEESEFKDIKNNSHVSAVYEKPIDFNMLLEKIREIS